MFGYNAKRLHDNPVRKIKRASKDKPLLEHCNHYKCFFENEHVPVPKFVK